MNSPHVDYSLIRDCNPERPRSDTASIVELPGGELLCAYHSYSAGPDGGGDFGAARIYTKRSADGGVTWRDEELAIDIDPGDLNVACPSLTIVGGRLLLVYLINHARTVSSTLIRWSDDGGRTFSDATPIWDRIEEHRFCGYDGFIHMGDHLLLPFQTSKEVWTPKEQITIGTLLSIDSGITWNEQPGIIYLPMRGAMEPSIARFSDGDLIMSMRTQLGSVFVSESSDDGANWSLPRTTGLKSPESCTCLRRLPESDSLVLFWNDSDYMPHHHHYGMRTPLSVARSDDRGQTWKRLFTIEDRPLFEYTNLSCAFTSDGNAILTYLEGDGTEEDGFNRSCLRLKSAVIGVDSLRS